MKVLIIEDEPMAQASLIRLLMGNYTDIDIVGTITSVKGAVEWLNSSQNSADVIFMDVELSDGNCFEIFRQTEVKYKVIITTAYDNYAIKAFEVNSVDYLLKPIDAESLRRAVTRARKRDGFPDLEKLAAALAPPEEYRKRFIVKFNNKIIPVEASAAVYFYSEDKSTFLVTREGKSYAIDQSLDDVYESISHKNFFRISRRCIISIDSIQSVIRQDGRLLVEVSPQSSVEMTVSRARVDDFLDWLER